MIIIFHVTCSADLQAAAGGMTPHLKVQCIRKSLQYASPCQIVHDNFLNHSFDL